MSQSPSETTRAGKRTLTLQREEKGVVHRCITPTCQRDHLCQPNCSEAFLVALVKWCSCLLEWIGLHCWLQSVEFPFPM